MIHTTQIVAGGQQSQMIRANAIKDIVLDRQIGSGATSAVFLAHHAKDASILYAVKLITQYLMTSEDALRRWTREAELLISLEHPHIVRGISHGLVEGRPYLVMEFLQGESLMDRLKRLGKLPQEEVFTIAECTLKALLAANERNIIHRDIKPANILWTSDNVVKVMDFGLAKMEDDSSITQTGHIVGTPIYVSPEQAACERDITTQSDLYALGVTLFHLACGRPPFSELNTSLLLTRKVTDDVPDIRHIDPTIGGALAFLVYQLCQRERENRTKSPREGLDLLSKLRSGEVSSTGFMLQQPKAKEPPRPVSSMHIPVSSKVLQSIADDSQIDARPHFLKAGQVLFYEDEDSRECYILLSGKVDVLKSGRSIAVIEEPGSFIGEMSPLRGAPRSATVIGKTDSVMLVVQEKDFYEFFSRHVDMALALAKSLATRLESTSNKLEKASAKLASMSRHVVEMNNMLEL
ncbi:hypothetical protein BH09SUM1_BH09SUM1_09320 [soil metagenome]